MTFRSAPVACTVYKVGHSLTDSRVHYITPCHTIMSMLLRATRSQIGDLDKWILLLWESCLLRGAVLLRVQAQCGTCICSPDQDVARRDGAGRGQGLRDYARGCSEVGRQRVHLQLAPL